MNLFKDIEFQKILLQFICRDSQFLKECGYLLTVDDFKPASAAEGNEVHILARIALDFYNKSREPIRALLRIEALDFAEKKKLGDKQVEKILDLVKEIQGPIKPISIDAIAEKVVAFKRSRMKKKAVEKMIDLEEKGELTDDKFLKIALQAVETFGGTNYVVSDVLEGYKDRQERRKQDTLYTKYPYLFIRMFDERTRSIKRGQLGLILAYLKGGKSLWLLWIAIAYMLQGLNVLYFTLEDPLDITEDRFDAAITSIAMKDLIGSERKFKKRFKRMRLLIKSRLKIVDGTEGAMSIARMEEIIDRERNKGFIADAIVIDYLKEIEPAEKYKGDSKMRFELSDTTQALRRMLSRKNLLGWSAHQAGRKASGKKIIGSNLSSEDISIMQKATLVLGVGQNPDWGKHGRYLHIAASKIGIQEIGWPVMSRYDKGLAYSEEDTLRMMAKEAKKKRDEE